MITHRVDVADPHTHLFELTLTVPNPAAAQRVSLPVWIPGSYLVREFARHLSELRASQGSRERPLRQIDKATWEVECSGGAALTLRYRVHAFDTSVRAAFLDAHRGFFNGTALCLRVHGREAERQRLQVGRLPRGWQVATAMPPELVDEAGRGSYVAADYDELVDHPVELGRFWRGRFEAHEVPHELVIAGALPDFDGDRLIADTQRICEAQIAFWHGGRLRGKAPRAPFTRYVFLLNTCEDGHGGLEHRASTALLSARRNLPRIGLGEADDNYVELLGLISHEYFHTWNVKRLRPADFTRYDYTQENYTELLWFFEGFTSYYDDLILRRCGLIDGARYLRLLGRTVSAVQATPGRQVQSVAQASFDAWVKYYRSDENTPNSTVSYYAKGSLVALALDLSLRKDGGSLDAALRRLWERSNGGPVTEADIAAALAEIGGRPYERELADWAHGTGELPLQELLGAAGIAWQQQPPTLAQRLGLRVSEAALTGVKVSHVLRGSAAETAGLAAGDELIAVDGWRLRRLEDATRVLRAGQEAELLVSRDQRVRRLVLDLPADALLGAPVQLALAAKPGPAALALREAWLGR